MAVGREAETETETETGGEGEGEGDGDKRNEADKAQKKNNKKV